MPYRSLYLSLLLLLTSCSYALDEGYQELTIVTPGAYDALCDVYADDLRFKFHPPETRTVPNAKEDLVIECRAPGNRYKKIIVEPDISKNVAFNISNGGFPGVAWDSISGALYTYPDVIEVDFRGIPVRAEEVPAHNNPDIKQPEEYFLEEFGPSQPRMNDDRYVPPVELKRRVFGGHSIEYDAPAMTSAVSEAVNPGPVSVEESISVESVSTVEQSAPAEKIYGKGDLMTVLKNSGGRVDPSLLVPTSKASPASAPVSAPKSPPAASSDSSGSPAETGDPISLQPGE